ncbi:sulfate transporter CysZ [Ferrimonas lipolytica]|uniref:Sulfate transporter CysZ n=1 Tax=Ferrimonas lipolytica TaxID=2724191 RepID=A0A6H1UGF2_9GAMM|nr:sulfate transporter CysZ [Ferrimonas lipolytica]QIZ76872.1 sulfate transporter CysZ [Ferrimonas lipolytica]
MNQPVLPAGASGVQYLLKGLELIRQPGLRRFVVVPLGINLILFSAAFYFLFQQINVWMEQLLGSLPQYLDWLNFLLWPLIFLSVVISASYLFTTVMNFIAAPFNGLLAEQVEKKLTGETLDTGGMVDLLKDTPRLLGRELTKLGYYLPRALLFLIILFFVPGIGAVAWFAFTAWMMAIQYLDYPFDNHKVPFSRMKSALKMQRWRAFTFGATCAVIAMVPIVNLILMPVAICGATAYWVDQYREVHRLDN